MRLRPKQELSLIKKRAFKLLFILSSLLCCKAEASFFNENKTGWHWYQDPEVLAEMQEEILQDKGEKMSALDVVNSYKKELEQRLHTAWVNPSFKNVKAYQELQKEILDKAQDFSEMWMQVIYKVPALDHTLIAPVNHKARHLYFDRKQQKMTENIQALAKTHGLFFFFDKTCSFCQAMAPIVQLFAKRYHWEVLPISRDGASLKEFPNSFKDNGITEQWKIDRFPALFVVNPQTEVVTPIAYGMISLEEIEERIRLLFREGEGS